MNHLELLGVFFLFFSFRFQQRTYNDHEHLIWPFWRRYNMFNCACSIVNCTSTCQEDHVTTVMQTKTTNHMHCISCMGDWCLLNNMNQSLMCTFPSTTNSFGSVLWLCSQCSQISLSGWLCTFLGRCFNEDHFSPLCTAISEYEFLSDFRNCPLLLYSRLLYYSIQALCDVY